MDRSSKAISNIHGSYSRNTGNDNASGSHNDIVVPGVTNFGVGSQSDVLGAGDGAPRPYRLIPYSRNSTFTGRKNLIELARRFSQPKGHNRIAFCGLGGSGKTQIALEYVYQSASERDCNIFWVGGGGALKFSEGFRAIAQHVRIPLANTEADEERFLLGIRRWFEGPKSGDWILVVDDADNEANFVANNSPIAKFIPQGTKGTLVFTTRSRAVASRQGCKMIEVGEMGEEEARMLFSKHFDHWYSLADEEKSFVSMILDLMHHLPLAIVGSAAFMAETMTPPSVYWTIFQENDERTKKLLSQQFCDIQREAGATESILGTYFLTFDRIAQQMPPAADLLRLIAFFDRQNIPEELLSQSGLQGMDDPIEFRLAIGKLLGFSLVTIIKYENKTFYELHRLVQFSLQVHLRRNELDQWRAVALKVISRLFPQYQNQQPYGASACIPHALAVTKELADPIAEGLGYRIGQYFLHINSCNDAEIQFRRCIALREEGKEYGWDNEGHERFRHLGLVSVYQGKTDKAESIFRDLLEDAKRSLGPSNPRVPQATNDLAMVLRHLGKHGESETMNRRAVKGSEKILGPDHPNALTSIDNLAIVLQCQGKHKESEAMNRRALGGWERVFGPNHPNTLASVNNLARVLQSQGRYDELVVMDRRALEVRERILGRDHPESLISANSLAMVLYDQGKSRESEAMHRGALEGYERILGPDHPNTLTSVSNLALVLQYQGKYDESEAMSRRALEGYERILGPDHPNTLTSVSNLAFVLQSQGKYDESEAVDRRVLGGRKKNDDVAFSHDQKGPEKHPFAVTLL